MSVYVCVCFGTYHCIVVFNNIPKERRESNILSSEETSLAGGAPERFQVDVNGRSLVGVDGGAVLRPGSPDLLAFGVHNDDLSITGLVESSDVSEHGLRGDLAVLSSGDACNADVT